MSTDLRIYNG